MVSRELGVGEFFEVERIEAEPRGWLASVGRVFAEFGEATQDSGNVSFGVEVGGRRFFVKTAGAPEDERWTLAHAERVALLRNAAELARSCEHSALPRLFGVVETRHGPALVYEWVDGELLRAASERREDPETAFQRFRALPAGEIAAALSVLFELHLELEAAGWVAGDFYDGSLIYDFAERELHVVDLDSYHRGVLVNEVGRMPGSTRFMAPEEFERGATIDQRTTVFNLGRTVSVFLGDGSLDAEAFRGSTRQHEVMRRACEAEPGGRYASVAELASAWAEASERAG